MVLNLSGVLSDVMNCAKFGVARICSLRATEGQNLRFALKLEMALTTLPGAAVLACDVPFGSLIAISQILKV